MYSNHMTIRQLPYRKGVKKWLNDRYSKTEAEKIWQKAKENYQNYLEDLPDYGGSRNGHAKAIYGGLLIFALYPALPDQPPVSELQDFVSSLFMGPFTRLGKIFNLNRPFDMWLIDKVFRRSGNKDRKDILTYPDGFINVDVPYDKRHHAARYRFTQCPNAEFAKKHDLMHVLPLLCNSDFFGISGIHGKLIRQGTCGNSDACDYLVVGSKNPIAGQYERITDEGGFWVSRKIRTPVGGKRNRQDMSRSKLDRSFVFKYFRKELIDKYGMKKGAAIWRYAGKELQKLEDAEPDADKNSRSFVFPAVALYRAVERYAPGEGLSATRNYGKKTGIRFRNIFRMITAVPGIPTLMWKNMDRIAAIMSSGYECRNLIVTDHLCSLDVAGCPLYDKAKELGTPEAAQMICCMDKEYMTGFRGIEYTRTKSVAEGDDCCDYRLKDSRSKTR